MSVELVRVDNRFYLIEGNPADGYDLFVCRLDHIAHDPKKYALRAMARLDREETDQ